MGNSFKYYIKYILLIIISVVLIHIFYFQSKEINELRIINNELKNRANSAFKFVFSTSNKSTKLADSLEALSYVEPDSHYDDYKDLFKKTSKDLREWIDESNQLVSLGTGNNIGSNTSRYSSTVIINVVEMYRSNNISPADFSKEWRITLQDTATLLRSLNESMDHKKSSGIIYMHRDDFAKREIIAILHMYLDDIYEINNIEYERLKDQIGGLLKKD